MIFLFTLNKLKGIYIHTYYLYKINKFIYNGTQYDKNAKMSAYSRLIPWQNYF